MRLLRVFPRRTSHTPSGELVCVGDPPLFRPESVDEIHVSVTFTWDRPEAERLVSAWQYVYPGVPVRLGGPAYGDVTASAFVPGRYIKEGVTFTSRGCNRRCPWCLVPEREGALVEIPDFHDGWILNDNNFLQARRAHQERVFEMLRRQPKPIQFAGGLDCRLVDGWFAEQLRTIRLEWVFLAADTHRALHHLEGAMEHLGWLPRKKLRCYTLIGFGNDTIEKATARLERVWDLGPMPHAQLYQPDDDYIRYDRDWKRLARLWSRPILMGAMHKKAPEPAEPSGALDLFGGGDDD